MSDPLLDALTALCPRRGCDCISGRAVDRITLLEAQLKIAREALEDIFNLDDEGHTLIEQRYQDIRWARRALAAIEEDLK